ncbi:MAG: hypothetical protein Fur0022_07250 [Anaerolineales bacterium]
MPKNFHPLLRQISLFSDLPEEMIAQIAQEVRVQQLAAQEVLFHKGEEGDTLYFIQTGEIEIFDEAEGNKKTMLATLKAGEYFGEMALIEEKPRSASARAVTPTSLLTLDRKTFLALLENNAKLSLKMTSVIAARLRTSQPATPTQPSPAPKEGTSKVFISYSRKDKTFVQQLNLAIAEKNIQTWVDWENIPLTADWWHEIQTGIEKADAFAFVISPDSLNSEVCGREIQTAVDNHKRLIPILHREPQKGDPMHEKISSHNWVYMRSEEEMRNNLAQMLDIVNTDLGWVRQHTRLRERALEWERAKKNPSFLLQGTDLQNAEQWLENAGNKQPAPSSLHIEYIQASRRVSTTRQRALLTYTAVGLGITLILAVVSFVSFLQARTARELAQTAQQVAEANAATAQAANELAQNSAATAEADRNRALDAQATAVVDRNLAATAQAVAEEQEFIARAGRLETLPITLFNTQLDAALLLSIEAYRFNPSLASERTLFAGWSQSPEILQYFHGHQAGVMSVAWSPTGVLASGSEDGIVILWDSQGIPTQMLKSHEGEVKTLAWSADGRLASADSNGTVILWNLESGQPAQMLTGHIGAVNILAWTPENQLTSGGDDGTIIFWNLAQGTPAYTLSTGGAGILDLDWSPTGVLASAASDSTVTIWGNASDGEDLFETAPISPTQGLPPTGVTLFHDSVQSVAWSPDEVLVSGAFQEIYLWNLAEQQPRLILQGHSLWVNDLAWSNRGDLISGSTDNAVILWDLENGRPKKTFRGHNDWVMQVAWSPDGKIASAALDRTVILWSPDERAGETLANPDAGTYTAAYSTDGTLASGGSDGNVLLWDVETRTSQKVLFGDNRLILNLAWSPDGQLASGGVNQSVIVWDVENGGPEKTLSGHPAEVNTLAWSADGQLASSDYTGTVILWDLDAGQPKWTLPGSGVSAVIAWSPANELTIGALDGTITVLDAQTFEPVNTLRADSPVHALAWSADGRLASDGNNYQVVIWNLETAQPEMSLRGHSNTITTLEWSVDGKLASGAEDSRIVIWALEEAKPAFILAGHTGPVVDLSWTSDGTQLASASLDLSIIVWEIAPEAWITQNCIRAGRNFRSEEWENFFPGEDYRVTCSQWPALNEAP